LVLVAAQKMSAAPWRTAALIVTLLLAHGVTGLADFSVFDRSAFMRGEWWRLFTGHWVHFTDGHLFFNLLVIGATGWFVERRQARDVFALCALTILAAAPVILFAEPVLQRYGGGSGIAYALVVYAAVWGLSDHGVWRTVSALVLGFTALKLLVEISSGWTLSASGSQQDFVPVPLVHAAGIVAAIGLWRWRRARIDEDCGRAATSGAVD
jgi:rhomboid family GlyGly-CTERM serine protease